MSPLQPPICSSTRRSTSWARLCATSSTDAHQFNGAISCFSDRTRGRGDDRAEMVLEEGCRSGCGAGGGRRWREGSDGGGGVHGILAESKGDAGKGTHEPNRESRSVGRARNANTTGEAVEIWAGPLNFIPGNDFGQTQHPHPTRRPHGPPDPFGTNATAG